MVVEVPNLNFMNDVHFDSSQEKSTPEALAPNDLTRFLNKTDYPKPYSGFRLCTVCDSLLSPFIVIFSRKFFCVLLLLLPVFGERRPSEKFNKVFGKYS